MKKSNLALIIIGFILLVCIITNPNAESHKQTVKEKVNTHLQNSLLLETNSEEEAFNNLGTLIGGSIVDNLIENSVRSDNYLIFSITKITWQGNEKKIGYGFLGNVFISKEVDEVFNRDKDYLRNKY